MSVRGREVKLISRDTPDSSKSDQPSRDGIPLRAKFLIYLLPSVLVLKKIRAVQ
jgi:hypothetical protein